MDTIFKWRITIFKKALKFWRYANRNCHVLLYTDLNDEFVRFSGGMTDHSHLLNPAELEIRNLREAMWQRAENELLRELSFFAANEK